MRKIISVALALCAMILVSSCGKNSNDPKEVVKNFTKALAEQDYDEAVKYCTEETKPMLEFAKMATKEMSEEDKAEAKKNAETYKFTVVEDSIGEEKGWVKASIKEGQDPEVYNVVKKDGKWLVEQTK